MPDRSSGSCSAAPVESSAIWPAISTPVGRTDDDEGEPCLSSNFVPARVSATRRRRRCGPSRVRRRSLHAGATGELVVTEVAGLDPAADQAVVGVRAAGPSARRTRLFSRSMCTPRRVPRGVGIAASTYASRAISQRRDPVAPGRERLERCGSCVDDGDRDRSLAQAAQRRAPKPTR